ncbi:MAG: HlyD family efflux transporter periplasmic adaptor subunit [Ilumatobacter sp.]
MSHCAVLRRLGVPLAFGLLAAGCGVPDQSRWERGAAAPVGDAASSMIDDTSAVALVEVGPVVAAVEVRGEVRVVAPVLVFADGPGRLERRTTAVGDTVVADELVLEFSGAPDPTDGLRLDILQIEREIAQIEGRTAAVEQLDLDIITAQSESVVGPATVVAAPVTGTISEYFVSVFDVVAEGDPLFALGDASVRHVVADISNENTIAIGDDVSLVEPGGALGEPFAAVVSTVTDAESPVDESPDSVPPVSQLPEFSVELVPDAPFEVGDEVIVVFESTTASSSLRLPADAVRNDGRSAYVIVVDSDGSWRRVAIDVGARTDRFVQVLAAEPALAEGDQVLLP